MIEHAELHAPIAYIESLQLRHRYDVMITSVWQNKRVVMCAVVQQTLSEYYYKLDSKRKARYFEKSKFCPDVSRLPALRLVLYSPGIKAVVILSTFF